jgi:exonuclease SbcC
VLQTAIDTARADVNRRKKAISDALEHEQSSQAALIKAEATLQNASTSLHDCADEVERSRLTLMRD